MMTMTDPVSLSLVCHPRTTSRAICGIEVVVDTVKGGIINLAFTLVGDLSALRIPEPQPPRQADGLWRHTCLEVFVRAGKGPGYREFNFSPSGEWAVYTFHGYREGGEQEVEQQPGIAVRRAGDRLELAVEMRTGYLPPCRSLRLGLSAVMEDTDGVLSYWALRHPAGRPDFHHPDAFALQLEQP